MISLPLPIEVVPAREIVEIPSMKEKSVVDHLLGYLQQLSSSVISMSLVKM